MKTDPYDKVETRAEYAPSPWTVRQPSTPGDYVVDDDNGARVAVVHGLSDRDARLIAAAPELLEAAERVLRNIEHPADEFNPPAVRDLRTAIAKAKGGPDA